MDSRNADILQIKKYLEGKLDTRAMYELERRALDDPFLMDAMEGYEAAGSQHKASAELTAVLNTRLQKAKARVFSLSRLAMAASVITLLGVGAWFTLSRPAVNKAEVVAQLRTDKTEVAPSPLVSEPQISIIKERRLALNTPKAIIRSLRSAGVYREPAALSDMAVTSDETAELASAVVLGNGTLEEVMTMKAGPKTDSVPLNEMLVMGFVAQRKKTTDKAASAPVSNVVKGRVVSTDGEPLPGVIIKAGESGKFAVTGADGYFTLNLDSLNTNLAYNYIGFNSKRLNIGKGDNAATVVLEPQQVSLTEVVVVKPNGAQPEAQPKYGWENFQKYLNANSVSPNGKAKSYRVSFTVERDGSLSNFELNKTDNDVAGKKAIQLIKNGPEWVGSPQGQPKKITVTVKFYKPEN